MEDFLFEFQEIKELDKAVYIKLAGKISKNIKELQIKLEKEIGDVFFALVNYARFLNINPENALRLTNEKFIKRFNYVQKRVKESGKTISDSNLEEMDKYWNESKKLPEFN